MWDAQCDLQEAIMEREDEYLKLNGIDFDSTKVNFWHGYDWFFEAEITREDFVGTENGVLPKDIIRVCEHPHKYDRIAMINKGSILDEPLSGFDFNLVVGGFMFGITAILSVAGLRQKCMPQKTTKQDQVIECLL